MLSCILISMKITSRSYLLVPKDSPILHRLKLSLTSSTLTSHQRKGHCWFWGKCSFLCSNVYSHTKLANTCSTNGFDLIVWSTAVKTWSSRSSHSSPTEKETLLASAVVPVLTMHQHGVKRSSTYQPESNRRTGDSDKGRQWSDLTAFTSCRQLFPTLKSFLELCVAVATSSSSLHHSQATSILNRSWWVS